MKLLLLLIVLLLNGCGLFDTRSPESPVDDNSVFIPPTSADMVIDNFLVAINTKNIDNYSNCFTDSFNFVPSTDANLNYPNLFEQWQMTNERKYFSNLVNALGQSNNVEIILANTKYETQTSDSIVLFADYNINLELSNEFDTKYSGTLSLTIIPIQNGIWAISNWIDFHNDGNTNKTFSELKAKFSN